MSKILIRVLTLTAVIALVIIPACGGDEKSGMQTGTIILAVTDRPDENISSIVVTSKLIEANVRGEENEESDWQVLLDAENQFDLIKVSGIEDILGETSVPAATYNQVRMHVKSVIVELDGKDVTADIPSGIIRLVHPFEVKQGEVTRVTFDFNAEESIVVSGADKVVFKPVVKLLVREGNEPFIPISEKVKTTGNGGTPDDESKVSGKSEKPVKEEESTPPELPLMMYGDEEGFFLNITSPAQPEIIIAADTILVSGMTSVDAAVSVGDEFIEVGLDGSFSRNVKLEDGINIIEVIASITSGEQYNQVIIVIYTP